MRAFLFALFVSLSSAAFADIPKPATLDDTLDLMLPRLLDDFPDARIDRANRNIILDSSGDAVINPDNIHAVLRSIMNGADREAELDAFMATMIAASTADPLGDVLPLDRIYPVLRHVGFVQAGAESGLYSEPFLGDMRRMYAIDYPDYVAYVTQSNFDDGLTVDTLQQAAQANLTQKTNITQFEQNGGFYMALTDGFYESSLMLDTGLWGNVADQLGEEIVMIVPARDLLVFAPVSNASAVEFLEFIRTDTLANGTHQLSEMTYVWRDGRWQILDDNR